MKRAIYPLYAPADESRVKPILDALKKKGVTVRGADPRKGDALMLFLSESLAADSPEADAFFRLNAGRALVIPVNLDGSTPPEELQRALMARHGLDGMSRQFHHLWREHLLPRAMQAVGIPEGALNVPDARVPEGGGPDAAGAGAGPRAHHRGGLLLRLQRG